MCVLAQDAIRGTFERVSISDFVLFGATSLLRRTITTLCARVSLSRIDLDIDPIDVDRHGPCVVRVYDGGYLRCQVGLAHHSSLIQSVLLSPHDHPRNSMRDGLVFIGEVIIGL